MEYLPSQCAYTSDSVCGLDSISKSFFVDKQSKTEQEMASNQSKRKIHRVHQNLQTKPDQPPPPPPASLITDIDDPKRPDLLPVILFVFTVVMENFHQPFFPSTTTTMTPICEPVTSSPSTLASSSISNYFQSLPPTNLPPTNGDGQLYFQSLYPHFQKQASQPPFQYPRYPLLLPRPQPNPVSGYQGGIESKAGRDERRMARQRRLFLSRSTTDSVSSSSSTQMDLCGAVSDRQNTDLCTRTPDMKELRKLFKKELKKSDVSCWGRIVIPKKEAEKYLPSLVEKQGIMLRIRDVHSSHVWGMKYKYWANNRSRMYVFESAGSFIRTNRLEVGDCISLYEDNDKNFYFSIDKAGTKPKHVAESSHEQKHYATKSKDDGGDNNNNSINTQITNSANNHRNTNTTTYTSCSNNADGHSETNSSNTKLYTPYTFNEEDELYLAALLEDESDKVVTLSVDPAFSQTVCEANSSINNVINSRSESSTQQAMAGIWPHHRPHRA